MVLKASAKELFGSLEGNKVGFQMPCRDSNVQAYIDKTTSLYFRKIFWETKCACNYFLHFISSPPEFSLFEGMEKKYFFLHQFFDTLQCHLSLYCLNNIDSKPSMKHVGGSGKNFFQKAHIKKWRISFWGRSTEKWSSDGLNKSIGQNIEAECLLE